MNTARTHRSFLVVGTAVLSASCMFEAAQEDTEASEEPIVGGVLSAQGAWPSTVAMRGRALPGGQGAVRGLCGGSLVAPRWVLTAAHCVYDKNLVPLGASVEVLPGVNSFNNSTDVWRLVKTIHNPPGLTAGPLTPSPDWVLLELSAAVPQRTVDLVPPPVAATMQVQNSTWLAGYGTQFQGDSSLPVLREVMVPFLGVGGACNSLTEWDDVPANEYCAGRTTGAFSGGCNGDSGSPNYLRVNGALQQLGVESNGASDCAAVNYPDRFVHTPAYYDTIMAKLPASEGKVSVFATGADGVLTKLKDNTGLSSKWSSLVAGKFGGSTHKDIFAYSNATGASEFRISDGRGALTLLASRTLSKRWTSVTSGDFGGGAETDLFFYDASARRGEFHTTDGAGNLTLLRAITDTTKLLSTWRVIVPGRFNADAFTDLFFYDPSSGAARIYTTDGAGTLTEAYVATLSKGWEIVLDGEFDDNSDFTDLLFYNSTTNSLKIFGTGLVSGRVNPTARKLCDNSASTQRCTSASFGTGFQYGSSGKFGGSVINDLVFYDPVAKRLRFFQTNEVRDTAGVVTSVSLSILNTRTESATWSGLLAANFNGTGNTDFLFYDRWTH